MSELAFRGVINFDTFDPAEDRDWQRLTFMMEAEERRRTQEFVTVALLRQTIVTTVPRLPTEDVNNGLTASAEKLSQLLKLNYPWRQFNDATQKSSEEEQLLIAYQEQFGKPGEERYENMLKTFNQQLASKRK